METKYKKRAILLIVAGIMWLILSVMYITSPILTTGCLDYGGVGCPSTLSKSQWYVFAYYLFNSVLLIISGFFLLKKNFIGLITFKFTLYSIIFSGLIPFSQMFLFFYTLNVLFVGGLFLLIRNGNVLILLLGIVSWVFILVNLSNLKSWSLFLRKKEVTVIDTKVV